MGQTTTIKGVSFLNRYNFVNETFGVTGVAEVEAKLSPATLQTFRSSSAAEWYPMSSLIELDHAIVDTHFGGERVAARKIGFYNIDSSIKNVYRVLVWVLNPVTVVKKSTALWKKIVSEGDFVVAQQPDGSVTVELRGLDPMDPIYCQVIVGALEGALSCCGAKEISVLHEASDCRLNGAPCCRYRASWRS